MLYGVYYLEQLLLDRGIPALRPMRVERRPRFDVRMFGEVFGTYTVSGLRLDRPVTRDTFSALSRFGANAVFTFVQLGDYLGDGIYPELANADRDKNLDELARLADLAQAAGIDLYLDAYNPKLPADHSVFRANPECRGAQQHARGIHCLCTSHAPTLDFIARGWADVFRQIPALGGMVAIIGGEGFYHCYMRSRHDGGDCPRCMGRQAEDVVADLTNAVFHACREAKPYFELLAWPYSAFRWSREPHQLDLIAKLDPRIQFVSEIDKDHIYQKNGYTKDIWDYSIDFLGPSDRYLAQADAIRARGAVHCCKTETATAWENTGVPYIPCMTRWGERMEIIRRQSPDSIYYAYDCTGFTRSRSEELAGRLSWEPCGSAEEEIRSIALRDFGPEAAERVIAAWGLFSKSVGHMPHLTHGYYMGPSFIGPGQPLMLSEEGMPAELFGRFFYLAENDLSEGTCEASMTRPVYASDIQVSLAEMADMDLALDLWEDGVGVLSTSTAESPSAVAEQGMPIPKPATVVPRLERAVAGFGTAVPESPTAVDERPTAVYAREYDLAEYLLATWRTTSNANHFFALRRELRESAGDSAKAHALIGKMEQIARAEIANAGESLTIVERNPSLDLAARLDLDFAPLAEIIRAKIRFMEDQVLGEQFPAERGKIG